MSIKVRIQSISDVITNSSTEVFIVYDSSNIDSIKQIINAILSIDGHYTFDDLFTINMNVDECILEDMWYEWDYYFKTPKPEMSFDDFYKHVNTLPLEELKIYEEAWGWHKPFFEGYSVNIKEGVEKTDKLQRAVDAIRSLDTIFGIEYSCDW